MTDPTNDPKAPAFVPAVLDLSPQRVAETYEAVRGKPAGVPDEFLNEAAWDALMSIDAEALCKGIVYRARAKAAESR